MRFLFQSSTLLEEDAAIALQSIDTLSNVIGDGELRQRILNVGFTDEIVNHVINASPMVKEPKYFEFVQDFLATYQDNLRDSSIGIANVCVKRIVDEQVLKAQNKCDQQIQAKCMNILKSLAQQKPFITQCAD